MLGDSDEAADVTQEVFIRLWDHRSDVGDRLLPWLLLVTRNACIDSLRHRRTVRNVVDRDAYALEAASSTDADPLTRSESEDFLRRVERAVERLSEPQRSIVILREMQDLSYAEISAALDLPLTTVKVYLHRARKALREELATFVAEGN